MALSEGRETVTVLGSTGSIGTSTVSLLAERRDRFSVVALVANKNAEKLAEQAKLLGAKLAVTADETALPRLKEALRGSGIEAAAGQNAVLEAASLPSRRVIAAIVGAAGLQSSLIAAKRGAIIGLANKETLVCAGSLVRQEARKSGATIIPVDSEHSAVFQVLDDRQRDKIDRIILTASGGPFRGKNRAEMAKMTPEQAISHPNWSMGAKISVDSATMMNKGLEIIEAFHLFDLPEDRIDVIIHPQSVIHSMLAYQDGSILAQMGAADMRMPISLALGWPDRLPYKAEKLDLAKISGLTFESPDTERFPALALARGALRSGGSAPIILNAANEVAVDAFLNRTIGFLEIAEIVEQCLNKIDARAVSGLDDILGIDGDARRKARLLIQKRAH